MTDKSEEQIARERAAVDAMKGAKTNMAAVIQRVETLETALKNAAYSISTLKGFISPDVFTYPISGTSRKCRDVADEAAAAIAKVLA